LHPLLIFAGGAAVVATAIKIVDVIFSKNKIFISYYYDKEKTLKRLLKAWNKNEKFDIEFEDMSADIALDTKNDQELEKELTKRIKNSDIILVLIGSKTHARKWVTYEIEEAVRLSKPIIAVKQSRNHKSPTALKGVGANWVYGFKAKKVSDAIKGCL
jgi:hypothetical protein